MQNTEMTLEEVLDKLDAALSDKDLYSARQICADILLNYPGQPEVMETLGRVASLIGQSEARRRFPGGDYKEWLAWFHRIIKPRGYLEIGIANGHALALAKAPTKAIGVDPAFSIDASMHTWSQLYKITSDRFFIDYDVKKILGGSFLDLVFLDGLHTFDQTLRDFMNVERDAHKNTVVLVHDIFPVEPVTAMRDRISQFWVGDTWKMIPILLRFRPDLKILTIPTFPSGLAVITNLDPVSDVLSYQFDAIVADYMTKLDDEVDNAEAHLNVVKADPEAILARLDLNPCS